MLGRRKTVFVVSAMFILGAIVTAAAPTLAVLLIGRFIIGIGIAVSAIVDVTYLTEISPIEYRGSGDLMIIQRNLVRSLKIHYDSFIADRLLFFR